MTLHSSEAPTSVTRWVITHRQERPHGLRVLTLAAQGCRTFATREEAEASLATLRGPQGLRRVLTPAEFDSLAVVPCPCWPGHHDPQRTVGFDEPQEGGPR